MRLRLFKENAVSLRLLMERLGFYGEFSDPVDSCDHLRWGLGYAIMVTDGDSGAVHVDVFFMFTCWK